MNGRKFSITTIIYLFILIDIFLFYYVGLPVLYILAGYQLSLIIGLFLGLRGQGHHKIVMYKLLSIADDPKFDDHEELRGHRLKQQIRHDSLEYDFWYVRNKIKRNKKKTKNFRGEKSKMKEKTKMEMLRLLCGLWLWFGFGLLDALIWLDINELWIIAIQGSYWIADLFFWLIMENEFGIFKKDVTVPSLP